MLQIIMLFTWRVKATNLPWEINREFYATVSGSSCQVLNGVLMLTVSVFCPIKGHTSSPTSVATISISTSAVTTTTNRDLHITPENPFGVIGEVATATTAFQSNFSLSLQTIHFQSPNFKQY